MDEGRGARGNCQRIAESGQVMGGGGGVRHPSIDKNPFQGILACFMPYLEPK